MSSTGVNQPAQLPETTLSDRALAGWEIVSIISSTVIAEWILVSVAGFSQAIAAIPVLLAIVVIIFSHRARGEGLRDVGFRFDNFLKAMRIVLLPMLVAAGLCIGIGWRLGSINFLRWHPNRFLVVQLALGFGWGLAQQYVLQGFLNRRAVLLLGKGWPSVFLIAVVFAALHLPNPWLTAITFAGGLVWSAVYQRAPNLFAVALSHSLMTWLVVSTMPQSALHHLRVGLRYFS